MKINPNEIISKMLTDRKVRIATVTQSHYWFFHLYFGDYVKYETAPFQREMFSSTEEDSNRIVIIVAFRGSAKSTIMTTSHPLWAILGKQRKKFVLILSQTQDKAQQHLMNIKKELEKNDLLKADLGPFQEESNQWGVQSLVISKFNAKISTGSVGQSIRGIRHCQYRPDLIILDDIEDLDSVKTNEGRKRTYDWFTGEVIPAGDKGTKIIMVGNLLHEDCLLKRLKTQIKEQERDGIYREYPIADENGVPLWPGKFPTQKEIEEERKKVTDDTAWQREYYLKIISDAERVVHTEWIQYYDKLPSRSAKGYKYTWTGVDLAISERDTADYTAMVSAQIYGYGKDLKIYILPNPVNERLSFPQQVERVAKLSKFLGNGIPTKMFIEEVAYQAALIQESILRGIPVEGVRLPGDKRAKLSLTTHLIQGGKILFPRHGTEELIRQLTGFGVEKHDDLADAFVILIHKAMEDNNRRLPEIWFM